MGQEEDPQGTSGIPHKALTLCLQGGGGGGLLSKWIESDTDRTSFILR